MGARLRRRLLEGWRRPIEGREHHRPGEAFHLAASIIQRKPMTARPLAGIFEAQVPANPQTNSIVTLRKASLRARRHITDGEKAAASSARHRQAWAPQARCDAVDASESEDQARILSYHREAGIDAGSFEASSLRDRRLVTIASMAERVAYLGGGSKSWRLRTREGLRR